MATSGTARRTLMHWPLPAVFALIGASLVVWWLTVGPAGDRVLRAVQPLFVNPATSRATAHVESCDQIGANASARIYICDVSAKNCSRFFQFAVFRESVYGAVPVWAPASALRHPCMPIHS